MACTCKRMSFLLSPSLYLQKLYCKKNHRCLCAALRYMIKRRFKSERILSFLLRSPNECKLLSNNPLSILSGFGIPYDCLKSEVCPKLVALGAQKYHVRLFKFALLEYDVKCLKKISRKLNSNIPSQYIFEYIDSLPALQFSTCLNDAISQLALDKKTQKLLIFLMGQIVDNDTRRIAYSKLKIPGELAYILN